MATLTLLGALDREGTRLMTTEIRELLDRGMPVVLDGSQVERIGTAGLQLLLSAMKHVSAGDPTVSLVAPSPALIDAARRAGLAEPLGIAAETLS